ncbi:MAG: hypothetical protein J6D03_00970 [Clostridia bacterium]|nr:hypothetical protein [Clostridia bacterium]
MKTLKLLLEEQEAPVGVNGFCILKPEFTQFEDEFCTLLNNNDWKIVKKVKKKLTKDEAEKLYANKKDESFYNALCDYMSSGECICCSCSKECDDPIKDMDSIKKKVRKQWGKDDMKNGMHSSDSINNVERESKLCLEGICESVNKTNNIINEAINNNTTIPHALEIALAEEFLAWYEYTIVIPFLFGKQHHSVAETFKEHAEDEFEDHAVWLMKRLNELDYVPQNILHPMNLNDVADHKYIPLENEPLETSKLIKKMIKSEEGAIDTYTKIQELTKDVDPVTNDKIIEILGDEIEHKATLEKYLKSL